MVGDVCGLSLVWCHLCNFKNGNLGNFCYLSVSRFFVPNFGMSAWPLTCTKDMGPNSDDDPQRTCVRTEDRWAKEIR
jgi:hypothetical protein